MALKEQAKRIRAARHYAGLSRLDLARRLEIHERTQINSELGNRHVKGPELETIAKATGVPMWFLEGGWDGWRATGPGEAGGSRSGSTDEKARQAKGDLQRGGDQAEPGPG